MNFFKIKISLFVFFALLIPGFVLAGDQDYWCSCLTPNAVELDKIIKKAEQTGKAPKEKINLKCVLVNDSASKSWQEADDFCDLIEKKDLKEDCGVAGKDKEACNSVLKSYADRFQKLSGGAVVNFKIENSGAMDAVLSGIEEAQKAASEKSVVPLQNVDKLNRFTGLSPQQVIGNIIKTGMGVIGTIALIMFIYGGILWMLSMGNAERSKKAIDILIWSALGVIVILASYAIVSFLFNAFV